MDSDSVTVTPSPPPNVTVNTVGLDSTPAGRPTKAYHSSSFVSTANCFGHDFLALFVLSES